MMNFHGKSSAENMICLEFDLSKFDVTINSKMNAEEIKKIKDMKKFRVIN